MNFNEFQNIPEQFPEQGRVGNKFLLGSLIEQKNQKKKGDTISYYEVIQVNYNGNIEYTTMFDVFEDSDGR
jgi:hypothetical protein